MYSNFCRIISGSSDGAGVLRPNITNIRIHSGYHTSASHRSCGCQPAMCWLRRRWKGCCLRLRIYGLLQCRLDDIRIGSEYQHQPAPSATWLKRVTTPWRSRTGRASPKAGLGRQGHTQPAVLNREHGGSCVLSRQVVPRWGPTVSAGRTTSWLTEPSLKPRIARRSTGLCVAMLV